MTHTRRTAMLAGLLYFSTHLTSVGAVVAYGAAAGSGEGLAAVDSSRILVGVALEVLLALGVLGTGVALLPLLRETAPVGAPAFAALRTLEAAVIAVGTLPMLVLVWARADLTEAASTLLVNAHRAAFLVGQGLIISATTVLIGTVLIRSGLLPAWIGALGIAAGTLLICGNVAQLAGWADREGPLAVTAALPAFAFEISFATCLVFRGLRDLSVNRVGHASATPAPVG